MNFQYTSKLENEETNKTLKDVIASDKKELLALLDKASNFQKELFPTIFPMLFMLLVFVSAFLVVISMFNIKVTSDLYWNKILMIAMLLIATMGLATYPAIQIIKYFNLMCIGGVKIATIRLKNALFGNNQ